MDRVQYKGFVICAASQQIRDSGRWALNLTIAKHRASGVTDKMFSADNTFLTQEEAGEHCIRFGRQIIDGQSATCTVDDLL